MSDTSDFKKAMDEDMSTRRGLGFAFYLDGLILAIIAAICLWNGNSFENMSAGSSAAIFFGVSALLLFTGYFLVKQMKIGDVLAWISSLITLILGTVMVFTSFKGTMVFDFYLMLTGGVALIFVIMRAFKEKSLIKK